MSVRRADFSGSWYPNRASECEKEIENFLKENKTKFPENREVIGGIVPHAGWYFSGSIACNAIQTLKNEKIPDVIVIFGMHLHSSSPCYIMKEGAWETPFGDIQIHKELAGELANIFKFNIETPENYNQENTIELQLPFIKYFFSDVKIVPMGVPPAKSSLDIGKAAAEISTRLGLKIKVIGSTDLTHYGSNYGFMPEGTGSAAVDWVRNENDKKVINAMLAMNSEEVIAQGQTNHNACCAGAAATAITTAKQLGAGNAETIAYATSYDKSPGDSFVGYVGVVFYTKM